MDLQIHSRRMDVGKRINTVAEDALSGHQVHINSVDVDLGLLVKVCLDREF